MNTFQHIPDELQTLPQWVCWTTANRGGKTTKVPLNASNGAMASSTDPATWTTFAKALAYAQAKGIGIGFVFAPDRTYTGVDLDACSNGSGLTPEAQKIVANLASYTERSPSGTGLHIIAKGTLPEGGRRKGKIEMYDSARFFCMTGAHLEGTPATVEHRQDALNRLHQEVFARRNGGGEDADLIRKAQAAANGARFSKLWVGQWQGDYPSQSEADAALCAMLAFWCGKDPARVDRLFRQSGLMRPKWDTKRGDSTYGADTVRAACELPGDTYEPRCEPLAPAEPVSADLLGFLCNDHGNAERLLALYGQDLKYCYPFRKWLVWDGVRWQVGASGQAAKLAKRAILAYLAQAVESGNEAHTKFAKASLDARRINSMLESAQCETTVEPSELDADPYLLSFQNGVVDLRTGQLMPHDRARLITKLIRYDYNPEALCPNFLMFLYRVLGLEVDEARAERLVKYTQKAAGYSLTGTTGEKVCFILWGGGSNGKTTLLSTLRSVMGDYAGLLQIETLMARREESNNAQADLADLRGLRFIMTSETEEGQKLAEGKLKRLTQGMGTVKAARKYENPVEFSETFKIWMDANHRPVVRGTDAAIWNRLHLIPFIVEIPRAEQDATLPEKLRAEAEGILAWAVRGAALWHQERLGKPPDVERASDNWRAESDALRDFLQECCVLEPEAICKAADLWKTYCNWAAASGERRTLSRTLFADRLREMGCRDVQERFDGRQARAWRGIGLLT